VALGIGISLFGRFTQPLHAQPGGLRHTAAGEVTTRQLQLGSGISRFGGIPALLRNIGYGHGFHLFQFHPLLLGKQGGSRDKQGYDNAVNHVLEDASPPI
jgi:hypothetical protein